MSLCFNGSWNNKNINFQYFSSFHIWSLIWASLINFVIFEHPSYKVQNRQNNELCNEEENTIIIYSISLCYEWIWMLILLIMFVTRGEEVASTWKKNYCKQRRTLLALNGMLVLRWPPFWRCNKAMNEDFFFLL